MAYNLGFAHGRITLTYNGGPAAAQLRADLARIAAASNTVHGIVDRVGKKMEKFSQGLVTMAKQAGKGAVAITALHNGVALVAAVVTGLINLTPVLVAGLSTLPAIILGAAVAFGVMKISTMGVSDALSAAFGDSKKFEEALKKLAPEAQKFARSWRDAGLALKPVQQAMQNAFFSGTAPQVAKISKAALGLKKEAVGVADGFNQVVRRLLEFGSSIPFIVAVRSSLQGVRAFLLAISAGVIPVLTGFSRLATQASIFGGSLGNSIALAMIKFGETLSKMNLAVIFDQAKAVLQPIGELLKNVGSIISSVFGAFATEGGGALGLLGELVGKMAEFLNTAQGQEALSALAEAMGVIAGATGEVFLTLLKELAPVIVALAPALAELALQVADILVPALETAGPILTNIAGFLADNMDVVGPLIIGIYGLVGALRAYHAITKGVAAVQGLLTAAQWASIRAWIASTAATIRASAALVWARIVTLASAAATAIASAATAVWGVITLIATSPITLIIIAILILIGVIVLIATKTTWFQDAWKWAWGGIKAAALAVWDWISGTLWPGIRAVWDALYKFIADNIRGIVAAFQWIWDGILKVIGFFGRLREQAIGKMHELLDFVKSLPGMIGDALSNLGNLLYDKGKALVQGFINGIKNMFGQVKDTAKNLVGMVTNFLPGSPAKEGPLSGKGWTPHRGVSLVAGLAEGMQEGLTQLAKVSTKVALTAAPVLPSAVGAATMGAAFIPGTVETKTTSHSEPVSIQNLNVNLQGIWDMTDPQASRKVAVAVHEEIEKVKGQYR